MSGFTLIELMVTVAIISIVSVFTSSIGVSFHNEQTLDTFSMAVRDMFRLAYSDAFHGKDSASFGVKSIDNSLISFEGDSYATRDVSFDTLLAIQNGIVVEGFDEVVFLKGTGIPDWSGQIEVIRNGRSRTIIVTELGIIE